MGIMLKANIKLQLGLQKHYIQSEFESTDVFLQSTLYTLTFSSWDINEKTGNKLLPQVFDQSHTCLIFMNCTMLKKSVINPQITSFP